LLNEITTRVGKKYLYFIISRIQSTENITNETFIKPTNANGFSCGEFYSTGDGSNHQNYEKLRVNTCCTTIYHPSYLYIVPPHQNLRKKEKIYKKPEKIRQRGITIDTWGGADGIIR
jgi:hypothetical protein